MTTECTTERLEFGGLRRQRVVGRFDGGELGSDGGGLLLRELAQRTGLFGRLSACFRDYREPQWTRHPVEVLVAARVLGLALGYEDLNDHDTLRQSKLWSLLCGAAGRGGRKASWQELPPGKSTLNRMELTGPALEAGERYKKIVADTARLDALLVDLFLDWHGPQPERIVGRIRKRWPGVEIWLRGDSGFCREDLMAWCEAQGVEYVLGIAQNPRLKRSLAPELEQARQACERTGQAARVFKDFRYRTLDSWSRERRVIGKAEHLPRGANPRFVVTSLEPEQLAARALYEEVYCARGDMENRIKEQQLALFADRTSAQTLRANQLRLYFASFAYTLLELLRRWGLAGTQLARAQCDTIRLKLLKIGVRIRVSVRAVRLSFDEGFPDAGLFGQVLARLQSLPLRC